MSFNEQRIVSWLKKESSQARTWMEFYNRTAHGVAEECKRLYKDDWQNNSLYLIHKDLAANLSIKFGGYEGIQSKMFYD